MAQKSNNMKRSRFNTILQDYTQAAANKANPEEIHSRLRGLLFEAIKEDIKLEELLEILSSTCKGGDDSSFISNVTSHYAEGEATAKVRHDEDDARKIEADKRKR